MAAKTSVLLCLICWACSPPSHRLLERRFPKEEWIYPDTVWGEWTLEAPAPCQDLELQIDLSEAYPWRNLYVQLLVHPPEGPMQMTRLHLVLSDSLGNWYSQNGKFRTFVARGIAFTSAGRYRIGLLPYIRQDTVRGVRRVALYSRPCLAE
ncbi:MAG: hypothetical protein KatS3mg026_1438 [Bacteroidia bacterium]|nr:MAG: hypothetical protein KatS3mg026_1438 [Bacteroidia bacterium]